jgi:hypothetical protein
MKILKNSIAFLFIVLFAFACLTDEDKLYSFEYIEAPTNVNAVFDITQDNTGLVTILPNSEGATTYTINFGDGASTELNMLESATHTYSEGVFQVGISAGGITGLTSEITKELVVTFKAPENLIVDAENDEVISKKVNISATADFATVIEFYFGDVEDEEPTVTLPGEVASHIYANTGDYDITVRAKSGAIATLDTTFTFTAVDVSSPVLPAPNPPVRNEADVISAYSDSYTDITVNEWNPGWGQATTLTYIEIDGNNTLLYENLDFTGIVTDYDNPTDLTEMTHVHFDYWTKDATELGLKLVNTAVDPVSEDVRMVPTVELGGWASIDIPLDEYLMDRSALTQILFISSNTTVYVDNLYFYTETSSAPAEAAPVPTANAADVISLYSDAYTNITINEWNPGWGQTTTLTNIEIEENNTLLYELLDFTGIVTDYDNPTDLSDMTYVHFDYWTNDATELSLKIVNTAVDPVSEDTKEVPSLILGSWISVDIPLADYSTDMSGVTQLLFVSAGATVYIDNLYFYKESADEPTKAAPTPTTDAGQVISLYSDAYTNITVNEWNPGWGQTTTLTNVELEGNNTLLYETLDFTGIVTDYDNPTDVSAKTHVHFDYWTNDATTLALKLVNTVASSEDIEFVSPITLGSWVGVDIPLSDYDMDLTSVTQLLFESSSSKVYIDNLYFY